MVLAGAPRVRDHPVVAQPRIPALEAAERFGAEHGSDLDTREALAALAAAKGDLAKEALALARLFRAVAELVALPGDVRHISPDAKHEAEILVGRVRRAVFEDRNAEKRQRTYLERRIILQAERLSADVDAACRAVVSLTVDDVHTAVLAPKLVTNERRLRACVAAAIARRPRAGRFPPPGGRWGAKSLATYEAAFAALCGAIGLSVAAASTRASERSRVARKRA